MGSPISGLIAEVVLQRIEHLVFTKYQPKFWARYVDDTFAIVKSSDVEHLKELLNSVDPNIQFTMEAETNNQLPFLDVLVRRWYRRFLGAVTALSWEHVNKINGASNIFYGWGGEDDDLAIRLRLNNITVDRPSSIDGIFEEFDFRHPRDKNRKRYTLIAEKNVASRWKNDGINQTRYQLLSRIDYDLFIWILVSV
ncbi:Beta-1,4-galactosyltransferase 3 [Sparganum proliferum]